MNLLSVRMNIAEIPTDATHVAGYVDGQFQTYPELVKRFPKAREYYRK